MADDAFSRLRAKHGDKRKTRVQKQAADEQETRSIERNIDGILSGDVDSSLAKVQAMSVAHRRNLQARQKGNEALAQHLQETLGPQQPTVAERKEVVERKAVSRHRASEGDDVIRDVIDILDGSQDQYGIDLQQRLRDDLGENSDTSG